MGRLTDYGPTVLVPAAWTTTLAAHVGVVARRTLVVALGVMCVLMGAFYVAGRAEMDGPVLGIWRRVIAVGLVATVPGTVDMALGTPDPVALGTLYVWMVLPGVAYVLTGREVESYRPVYFAGAALALAGTVAYALRPVLGDPATVAGLAAVGVGQTAGIVAAAVDNS